MVGIVRFISLFLIIGCQTVKQTAAPEDIAMKRSLHDVESGNASTRSTLLLTRDQKIDWQQYFKSAPTEKQYAELSKKMSVEASTTSAPEISTAINNYLVLGQLNDAETQAKLGIRRFPENVSILLSLAEITLRKNEISKAQDYLAQVKAHLEQPSVGDAGLVFRYRYIVALSLLGSGDREGGRAILKDLIGLEKTFTPAYASLAHSYLKDGKVDLAIFIATRGIDRAGNAAMLQNVLAFAYMQKGQNDTARIHLRQATELEPTNVTSLIATAEILGQSGDLEAAEQVLKRAIGFAPGDYASHFALAQCQRNLGLYESARQSYERALELNPTDAASRFYLAQTLYENLGRSAEALRLFREVNQLPDSNFAKLANAYSQDIVSKGL